MTKPPTATGYSAHATQAARRTCLYLATKLGDLIEDLVVVGGLVPSLLIPESNEVEAHVGTLDVDVGLSLALLDEGRYHELADRLRGADLEPDRNERGNATRHRWRLARGGPAVTVDFLMNPPSPEHQSGKLQPLEQDLAAIVMRGLELAFRDRERVVLSGATVFDEVATRELHVCGPGASSRSRRSHRGFVARTRMPMTCTTC